MSKIRLFLTGESGLFVVPSKNMQCGKMRQRIRNIADGLSALKTEMNAAKVRFDPKWANDARAFQLIFDRMWENAFGSSQILLLGNSVSWGKSAKPIRVYQVKRRMISAMAMENSLLT